VNTRAGRDSYGTEKTHAFGRDAACRRPVDGQPVATGPGRGQAQRAAPGAATRARRYRQGSGYRRPDKPPDEAGQVHGRPLSGGPQACGTHPGGNGASGQARAPVQGRQPHPGGHARSPGHHRHRGHRDL